MPQNVTLTHSVASPPMSPAEALGDIMHAGDAMLQVLASAGLPGADSGPGAGDVPTTTTAGLPKEDDQDFDRSSEATTIGMVVVESTAWSMPQHRVAADWQDCVDTVAFTVATGMAIAAQLLFPDMTDALAGLLSDAGSYDVPSALV